MATNRRAWCSDSNKYTVQHRWHGQQHQVSHWYQAHKQCLLIFIINNTRSNKANSFIIWTMNTNYYNAQRDIWAPLRHTRSQPYTHELIHCMNSRGCASHTDPSAHRYTGTHVYIRILSECMTMLARDFTRITVYNYTSGPPIYFNCFIWPAAKKRLPTRDLQWLC